MFLNGPIDDGVWRSSRRNCCSSNPKACSAEIALYINSPGGSVTSAFAIYDTMQFIGKPGSTCLHGHGLLGRLLPADGRHPGRRIALPNSSIMAHQPLGRVPGRRLRYRASCREHRPRKRRLNNLYAKHCGRTLAEVEQALDRDTFLDALEAKAWGLVDHVYETRAESMAGLIIGRCPPRNEIPEEPCPCRPGALGRSDLDVR